MCKGAASRALVSRARELIAALCSALLMPVLGIPAQERHGTDGGGPEKGHGNDHRAGAPPL